ncbi:MAG: MoaD/ThiS family protein [Promethearchaeota archaeon]
MKIKVILSGILQNIVGERELDVDMPFHGDTRDVRSVINWILDNVQESEGFASTIFKVGHEIKGDFSLDEINSSIIILKNEADVRIYHGLDTVLKEGDTVTFLAGIHGG